MSSDQRKYFLNEQLKSIQKELGIIKDDKASITAKFEERIKPFEASIPDEAPAPSRPTWPSFVRSPHAL